MEQAMQDNKTLNLSRLLAYLAKHNVNPLEIKVREGTQLNEVIVKFNDFHKVVHGKNYIESGNGHEIYTMINSTFLSTPSYKTTRS